MVIRQFIKACPFSMVVFDAMLVELYEWLIFGWLDV